MKLEFPVVYKVREVKTVDWKETVMSIPEIEKCFSNNVPLGAIPTLNKQAQITGDIAEKSGMKKVVDWVKANADLERGDRDVGLCFEDYLWFDYHDWQAFLKENGLK